MKTFNWYLSVHDFYVEEWAGVEIVFSELEEVAALFEGDYDSVNLFCYQVYLVEQELENEEV